MPYQYQQPKERLIIDLIKASVPIRQYWPYQHHYLFELRYPYYTLEVKRKQPFPDKVWKLFSDPSTRARWANATRASGVVCAVTDHDAVAWSTDVAMSLIYHQDEAIVTSHFARYAQLTNEFPSGFDPYDKIYLNLLMLDI